MNALWITKVSVEAECSGTADIRVEKRDLSSNPISCPQGLGIRAASEFNLSPASVQRRDEQGGCPISLLLLSTSSSSCCVDGPEKLYMTNKMVKVFLPNSQLHFTFILPPKEKEYKRWGGTVCTDSGLKEQQEPGGRKRPGPKPQWLLSQSILLACRSQEEREQQLASHTVTPHCSNKYGIHNHRVTGVTYIRMTYPVSVQL